MFKVACFSDSKTQKGIVKEEERRCSIFRLVFQPLLSSVLDKERLFLHFFVNHRFTCPLDDRPVQLIFLFAFVSFVCFMTNVKAANMTNTAGKSATYDLVLVS